MIPISSCAYTRRKQALVNTHRLWCDAASVLCVMVWQCDFKVALEVIGFSALNYNTIHCYEILL